MRPRRKVLVLAAVALVAILLAACGSDSKDSGTSSSGNGSTTTAASGSSKRSGGNASCRDLEGKKGVIRVFCDGPATAKVDIGGATSTVTGGTCDEEGGYYTLNLGAVTGPDFTGARPDYVGALFPDGGGTPDAVTVRVGGAGGVLNRVTGSVSADKQSIHLEGTTLENVAVSADITCR